MITTRTTEFNFCDFLLEAGLNGKRENKIDLNWDYYIRGNDNWLRNPLKTEANGTLFDQDLSTSIQTFEKGEDIQILSFDLKNKGQSQFANVRVDGIEGFTQISKISKPTTLKDRTQSGRKQERQELDFINQINDAISTWGGQITLKTKGRDIKNVLSARKNEGTNQFGKERYSDVILETSSGDIGISMKIGNQPPSLFGGGREQMYQLDKKYFSNAMNKAFEIAKNSPDFEIGSSTKLKDIFIEITNKNYILNALRGNKEMGGPVQLMGQGSDKPESSFSNGIIEFLNIDLIYVEDYARSLGSQYIRIRRRVKRHGFVDRKDKNGIPFFFGDIEHKGSEKGRIVTVNKPSSNGLIIKV